jgi:hypothetical protein
MKDDFTQCSQESRILVVQCGSKTIIFEMRIWNPYVMEGVDNGVAIILGDAEANRYLKRQYRKHWATPRDGAWIT